MRKIFFKGCSPGNNCLLCGGCRYDIHQHKKTNVFYGFVEIEDDLEYYLYPNGTYINKNQVIPEPLWSERVERMKSV